MFVEHERSAFYCKIEHEEGKKEIGSFIKSDIDKVSNRILSTMPTPNIMGYVHLKRIVFSFRERR